MLIYYHYQLHALALHDPFLSELKNQLHISYTVYEKTMQTGYLIVEDDGISFCNQFFPNFIQDFDYSIFIMSSYGNDALCAYAFSIARSLGNLSLCDLSDVVFQAILAKEHRLIDLLNKHFCVLTHEEIETLTSFLLHGFNSIKASEDLFIHRNTFHYRLQKIYDKLEIDFHSFNNAQLFYFWKQLNSK